MPLPEAHGRAFPFGLGTVASTLTQIMLSDWAYVERVSGRVVPSYSQWPIR